ncbi:polysaccharide biosynthesis/export family protein [Pedobacter sp. MW01-1-1]|uniref:polysaccharide biosynthesis/export family protein n=1 Tax=Pedobacter sp. MW01-1-1 TaxID=3383027 RepID=UPI003FF0AEDE
MSSCTSIKNYKYFADIPDSLANKQQLAMAAYVEPKIKSDDILYIAVQTRDASVSASINALNGSPSTTTAVNTNLSGAGVSTNQGATFGYLVDKSGNVNVPVLGEVKLVGLTTQEAKELISQRANKYFTDASVIVRFANFKVTVLGEVTRPGTYTVPNEKVSVLDALGYAGDLTIFGKRDNILLLRKQEDGTTAAVRLNITKSNLLQSPYFYLQQNDQLYVEPVKAKINNSDGTQLKMISIVTAVISLLIVIASRV